MRVRVRVRVKGEGQVDLEAVGRGALAHARLDRGQQRARAALLLGEDHGEVVAQRRGQQLLETAPRHLVRVRLRVRVRARARARVRVRMRVRARMRARARIRVGMGGTSCGSGEESGPA